MNNVHDDEPGLERCMQLFSAHQKQLASFIAAVVPSPADADEILQETNIVIWKKFEQFEPDRPGSDFLAWAFQIAAYQIRDYRRRATRQMPSFSPELVEQLAVTAQKQQTTLADRRFALASCVEKLSEKDRVLLEDCYAAGAKVAGIAAELRRTATSIYRSLRRIRQTLAACIDRQLERAN